MLATEIDISARILSMGQLHHAFTGTGALAATAAIEGTLVHQLMRKHPDHSVLIGHGAGIMDMQAEVSVQQGQWQVATVTMGRTARRLMEGKEGMYSKQGSLN